MNVERGLLYFVSKNSLFKFSFCFMTIYDHARKQKSVGRTVAKLSQFKVLLLRTEGKESGKNVGAGRHDLI